MAGMVQKGDKMRLTELYERACNFVEKIIKIKISPETEEKFGKAINFSELHIAPSGPISLVTFLILLLIPVVVLLLILGILTVMSMTVILIAGTFFVLYLYNYPFLLSHVTRLKASTEFVLSVLYMSMMLWDVPNMEKAVNFAASNMKGPIGKDLKRLMWGIQTRKYTNIDYGLEDFVGKWRSGNEEFYDAMQLLRDSIRQPTDRRIRMINEAVEVILTGTSERMKRYAADLNMPITIIYAMGIILPIMSLVLLPVVMIFLQDIVNVSFIIIFYNIMLPLVLFWFMNFMLERKPPTLSQPDVRKAEGSIPSGRFRLGKKILPILPISLVVFALLVGFGSYNLYGFDQKNAACRTWQKCNFGPDCRPTGIALSSAECKAVMVEFMTPSLYSSLILLGISFSIIVYCFLDTRTTTKIRDRVKRLEREFTEALFQLGHILSRGVPLERAIEEAKNRLADLDISKFYEKILTNIRYGMTFERSVFDKEIGAIRQYPSVIIDSVMRIIVEVSRKTILPASECALSISEYLKRMHGVEEKIRELLEGVVSSMKFLAMFLAPLTASITVAMAIIVLDILITIGIEMGRMTGGIEIPGGAGLMFGMWSGAMNLSPFVFHLILGVYVIEMTVLLSMFTNGIEKGEDVISLEEDLYKNLLVAVIIYIGGIFVTYEMFARPIASLLVSV